MLQNTSAALMSNGLDAVVFLKPLF